MYNVIYEPTGRAQEYSELACNLYKGCGHECSYCYAPAATRTTRTEFNHPVPRKDILEKITRDAAKMSSPLIPDKRSVLLSFTSDAYQPIEENYGLTRKAIKILHNAGFAVTILTKGGKRAERDFDLMTSKDTHAASLTFLDSKNSLEWEPKAAIPEERIATLEKAHSLGLKTWVSLEPVLDPAAVYKIIALTHKFVDMYKVGVLNYHSHAKTIDWADFAVRVVECFQHYNCKYYLKKDLRRWLNGGAKHGN